MLDLALANRLQIGERGVPEANIRTAGLCTACRQELFFSHRASGGCTRQTGQLPDAARGGPQKKCLTAGVALV